MGGVEGLKTGGGEVSSIGGKERNSLGASGRIVVCPLGNGGRVCFRAAGGVGEAGTKPGRQICGYNQGGGFPDQDG